MSSTGTAAVNDDHDSESVHVDSSTEEEDDGDTAANAIVAIRHRGGFSTFFLYNQTLHVSTWVLGHGG